VSAFQ
jgi:WD40 repeat protein